MIESEFLKKYNLQNKINKLGYRYRGKKIVLYPAGEFCSEIMKNCDLSGLNITGIADERFEQEKQNVFCGLNCIKPSDLKTLDYDVILVADSDYKKYVTILDEQILYGSKNAAIEIRPLISLSFWDMLKG